MIVDLSGFSTGICDRLRQVTFCATLAHFLGEDLLELYELRSEEGPFLIADLFEMEGIAFRKLHFAPTGALRMTPHNSVIEIATVSAFKPRDLNVSDNVFLVHWIEIFKRLKPKSSVIHPRQWEQLKLIDGDTIGIHVRLTDRLSRWPSKGAITRSQYDAFKSKKIPSIIEFANANNYNVFLATDNHEEDQVIRKLLCGKVSLIEYEKQWRPFGIRNTDGASLLIDLFGLAYSREIFSTTGGGMPLTASIIGGIDSNMMHIWTKERLVDVVFMNLRGLFTKMRIANAMK